MLEGCVLRIHICLTLNTNQRQQRLMTALKDYFLGNKFNSDSV